MGFSGVDDLKSEIAAGKSSCSYFLHASAQVGTFPAFYNTFIRTSGVPAPNTLTGTAGVATSLDRTSTGAIALNANVSTDTRHVISVSIAPFLTAGNPYQAILVDMLLYYPSVVLTGTPTTLDNTVTLPRYTNGKGVMGFFCGQVAGAGAVQITPTYTDDGGNAGNVGGALATSDCSVITEVYHAENDTSAFRASPFIPLAAGDIGIKKIESYTIGTGQATATGAFFLCKPILDLHFQSHLGIEKNFVTDNVTLPQIQDGACLTWLIGGGSATVASFKFSGSIKYAWG